MFSVAAIRKDFPMLDHKVDSLGHSLIYLDNAATAFKPEAVIAAVDDYYRNRSVNIHRGDYELSFAVSADYENTREVVAQFIHCQPQEVVFTHGTSDGLNLIAHGYGEKNIKAGDIILLSAAEHASNILPWFKLAELTGALIQYIPLDAYGQMSLEAVQAAIVPGVKLVSLASTTNILGYRVPMAEISRLAHQVGAIVVCDGAQSVPHQVTDVQAMGVDFLAFSAHKCCGPTGVGVLYGRQELLEAMTPYEYGGGSNARYYADGRIILKDSPYKFEAGTPAIEGVLGMRAGLNYLMNIGMDEIEAYVLELSGYLHDKVRGIAHLDIYNDRQPSSILAFNAKGIFPQDTGMYLNSLGIEVRTGNHCSKILGDSIGTYESVRASLYFYNTKEEIDRFVEALQSITLEKCIDLYL